LPSRRAAEPPSRRTITALALLGIVACARMGPPAGGPEDKVAPLLVATVPESTGAYPEWDRDVEFRFDEVVSEGGSPNMGLGTGDLEKLILLSPSNAVPVVRWKRDRITVHPREGWKEGRVYRVELLPGVTDLRRNKSDTATVLTLSTGSVPPTDTLTGLVIDWMAGRPARQALIELILMPDSLVYRAVTDSGGRFVIGPLPSGEWRAYGALDQNRNLRRDRREHFDSTLVPSGSRAVPPLWLIPRDTLGPRLISVTPADSLSALLTFSQPLDPTQRYDSLDATLRRQADSSIVPFRSLLPKELDDSLQKIVRARADSIRAANDTTRPDTGAVRPPVKPEPQPTGRLAGESAARDSLVEGIIASRPRLFDKLVLRVDSAWTAEARYLVEIKGIRSAAGVAGDAKNVLAIPKPPPPPPAPKDSTAADSTAPPPAPAPTP
jgi:hypothetical protein